MEISYDKNSKPLFSLQVCNLVCISLLNHIGLQNLKRYTNCPNSLPHSRVLKVSRVLLLQSFVSFWLFCFFFFIFVIGSQTLDKAKSLTCNYYILTIYIPLSSILKHTSSGLNFQPSLVVLLVFFFSFISINFRLWYHPPCVSKILSLWLVVWSFFFPSLSLTVLKTSAYP